MSIKSNDLLSTIKSASSSPSESARLGTVTGAGDALKIKFYGDEVASQKSYKRLSSYSPSVGDTVLIVNVNGSYVVVGKVV